MPFLVKRTPEGKEELKRALYPETAEEAESLTRQILSAIEELAGEATTAVRLVRTVENVLYERFLDDKLTHPQVVWILQNAPRWMVKFVPDDETGELRMDELTTISEALEMLAEIWQRPVSMSLAD